MRSECEIEKSMKMACVMYTWYTSDVQCVIIPVTYLMAVVCVKLCNSLIYEHEIDEVHI